jgi:hypothetical protein
VSLRRSCPVRVTPARSGPIRVSAQK